MAVHPHPPRTGTTALVIALLVAMILPAGCREGGEAVAFLIAGGTPTPYPTYTTAPTYTALPTYTVQPSQTPYPTYTPLPTQRPTRTSTPLPSATPVPTPAVEIPEAWLSYTDVLDEFSLRYPADWPVQASEPDHVSLDLPTYGSCEVVYYPDETLRGPIGEDASLNQLVEIAYWGLISFSEKLVEKGSLDEPYPMNYVHTEITSLDTNKKGYQFMIERDMGDGRFIVALLFRPGGKIKTTEIERAKIILGSVEWLGGTPPLNGDSAMGTRSGGTRGA